MILHAESGFCDSGIDIFDLNESAAECYQWRKYINDEYRDDLFNRCDLEYEYGETVYPFKCPACGNVFTRLSGLFQHVASKACQQSMDKGSISQLVKWLENRHG
jgi:predicted RNA-binding Zn-ribbon protein involved in translation (DUF1610 family)